MQRNHQNATNNNNTSGMVDILSTSARSTHSSYSSTSTSPCLLRRNSALENFMKDLLAGRSNTELIIDTARSSPTSKSYCHWGGEESSSLNENEMNNSLNQHHQHQQ